MHIETITRTRMQVTAQTGPPPTPIDIVDFPAGRVGVVVEYRQAQGYFLRLYSERDVALCFFFAQPHLAYHIGRGDCFVRYLHPGERLIIEDVEVDDERTTP